ncbi:hypothetical protein MVES_000144 [Malassezia vespertilionis]|uniref:Peptidase S26 domain-containing protein n=1 Tax=Malassezia vespertilionis TaxID=2020962 RepID=A0A2N1JHK3_9BASI|nr:hypothetical protein MVES_000144 [Malassezia vespertilionis]
MALFRAALTPLRRMARVPFCTAYPIHVSFSLIHVRSIASAPKAAQEEAPETHTLGAKLILILAWVPVALFITGNVPTFNPIDPTQDIYPSRLPSSDIVLLNRLITAMRNYHRGDIVTLYSPNDPTKLITKRILALGGDVVRLWVPCGTGIAPALSDIGSSSVTSLSYTNQYQNALRAVATEIEERGSGAWLTIRIPDNHAWIEGDASALTPVGGHPQLGAQSRDSREFGP